MNLRLLLVLSIFFAGFTYAQVPNAPAFYDVAHEKISGTFLNMSKRIDRFFSGQRADDFVNNSQIRLTSITTKTLDPGVFTQGRMRINLVLPGMQDKLQLVIEGQGDDITQQGSQIGNVTQTDDATSNVTNTQNTTTAALRFIQDFAGVKLSADSGVRVNIPPQIFGRLRFWNEYDLPNKWRLRPRQEIFWMANEGFQTTINIDFDKHLANKKFLFRFINRSFWSDRDFITIHTNGPSLFHNIDDKRGLSYDINAITEQSSKILVVNYITRVTYRQLLYQNWLFGEISPQLEFPRENNFHRTPSISVKFEVVLGAI